MRCLGIDIGGSSVKVALLDMPNGQHCAHARSDSYSQPDIESLTRAVATAVGTCVTSRLAEDEPIGRVGVCLPGLYDAGRGCLTRATNLPALEGVDLDAFLRAALRAGFRKTPAGLKNTPMASGETLGPMTLTITTDTQAGALDIVSAERLIGRVLCLSLGTGVGASVLDIPAESGALPTPLWVSGATPGHIGQLDVGLDETPPADAGAARGTLESYIGLAALRRTGAARDIEALMQPRAGAGAGADACCADKEHLALPQSLEDPMRALARALRICHAIYRPDHIRLAGGVGVALAPWLGILRARIKNGLTPLARENWSLGIAEDGFCAARGAARDAARGAARGVTRA